MPAATITRPKPPPDMSEAPAIAETEPEVLAFHFTEAGLNGTALEWWRKAGVLAPRETGELPRLHVCFLDGDHAIAEHPRLLDERVALEGHRREHARIALDARHDLLWMGGLADPIVGTEPQPLGIDAEWRSRGPASRRSCC